MTDDEIYAAFIQIMFNEWDADEMAYIDVKVKHPSYNSDDGSNEPILCNCSSCNRNVCAYCGHIKGEPGCTFCKIRA